MNCTRIIYRENGSITISVAILLSAVILLNFVLCDYIVMKSNVSRINAHLQLACESVLASYDSLLADKYCLYGYNICSNDFFDDNSKYFYPATECDIKFYEDFTQPHVLKKQIVDLMEIKTPVDLVEMILITVGALEASSGEASKHSVCAEAAEKLKEMQNMRNELQATVSGNFSGDVMCINGYKNVKVMALIDDLTKADNYDIQTVIDKIIGLQEQYYNYNNDALIIFSDLKGLYSEIESKLAHIDNECSIGVSANEIIHDATVLLNNDAFDKVSNNANVFYNRIIELKKLKELENVDLSVLINLFDDSELYLSITINDVTPSSTNIKNDQRNNIKGEILEGSNKTYLSESKYEIPPRNYALLPSVAAKKKQEMYNDMDFNSDSILDSFDTFKGLFAFWDDFSFGKIYENVKEKILIDEYIMAYMTDRTKGLSDNEINNEIEYILVGKPKAKDNDDVVEQKLLILRFLVNFIDIIGNAERSAIAESIAAGIAMFTFGAGTSFYKYIVIGGWALIDSFNDIDLLLKGEAVPIVKFNDDKLNDLQDYSFYLRILLLFMDEDTKLMRICDVIQINMQKFTGEEYMLSGVFNKIKVKAVNEFEFVFPAFLGLETKYKREDVYETTY